jgi:hypothetical protein
MWRVLERIFGRRPTGDGWDLRVKGQGRGGLLTYIEGTHGIRFDFELADPGIIYCPPSMDWDTRYSWAAGRRAQILERVASEFVRREFRGYPFEFEQGRDDIIVIRRPRSK